MKNINKKRVFLSSTLSFLIFLVFVTPCLAQGTSDTPEVKGNGTYSTELLDTGIDSGYYLLYANTGDVISVTITWDQNDINQARLYLDDPAGDGKVDANEYNEVLETLSFNYEALSTGGFTLRVRLYKDVSVVFFSLEIAGLTGSAPLFTDSLTNWIVIGSVAIAGIAAIVLIYKRV